MIIRREDPMVDMGNRPYFVQMYNLNTLDPVRKWYFGVNRQDAGELDVDQLLEMRDDINEIIQELEGGEL